MNWRQWLGIKTDQEIVSDVEREPTIKAARNGLARVDRILADLERAEVQRRARARR